MLLLFRHFFCLLLVLSSSLSSVLNIKDASSGVTVKIIGCMHYNPHSIKTTSKYIRELGENGNLGSVVIESCPSRWSRTLKKQPKGSMRRKVLDNEMQMAYELGMEYNRPVILGDQDIDTTNDRLKTSLKASFLDVVNPFGGWKAIVHDVSEAKDSTLLLPSSKNVDYLTIKDFLDPQLLLAAPFSILRYPLALILKAPVSSIVCLAMLAFLEQNNYFGSDPTSSMESTLDIAESAFVSILEILVFARPFLVTLLSERNDVLAAKIRESCEEVRKEKDGNKRVVVAILGMAHSNGVANLLANNVDM